MFRRISDRLEFTRRLGFRLGALLSVAILPLGLISLIQNFNLVSEAERGFEIALLGRTASAAAGERALLQSALGSADALGPAVLESLDRPQVCSDLMRNFIEPSATYVFAGFVPLNGRSTCNSASRGEVLDLSLSEGFKTFMADPGTLVTAVASGVITRRPVIVVMQPLYRDSEMLGYIGLSLTSELLRSTHTVGNGNDGARIVTFNHRGEILTAGKDAAASIDDLLPRNVPLASLLSQPETTFRAPTGSGETRMFTVVPAVPDLVYALGSWSPRSVGAGLFQISRFGAVTIPIALWLVSLAVAYFAVFRMVLRHINVLRGQMRRFAIGNRSEPPPVLSDAPTEICDVSQTFHNMARILIRDEEAMEEAVVEKTVLLKEVHHRVKNNLQLIASIINMQSRMIDDPDAKRVLRSVQDRVAALATIYRNLYQAEHLDAVEAGRLVCDIINQMVSASVEPASDLRIDTHIETLTLLPDQAVPLSLLATEAFTNALKYARPAPGRDDAPWVRVGLKTVAPGRALLEIANSIDRNADQTEGTGLGSQLIEAFTTQLKGQATAQVEADSFVLRLDFVIDEVNALAEGRNVVLTSAARRGARH
ncbi:sensor histidine kinase [Paracoccus sediminis]|uniref:histidine kinase n=1 Tax=Paracoccus sediminis TaxID=1214787 RepID=A0A238VGG6_9RHOB|nr:histidine kinase dimerization/phosphoacceptor domain -containing protein [Paracoccus sediminis]TBN52052.1 sensor histidine kinase [Paracoccus sediminis]SNR33254.1 Two-component sensor histidine kinase, contains HisKA and HATPase domains [Paracoccus sediminis]